MLKLGLVSIAFRALSPGDVVNLVRSAGLDGIEWGGDVHAPHGDVERAAKVKDLTLSAGLSVAAYGSYYRAGEKDAVPFADVLASAAAMAAPVIRIWAGKKGSADACPEYRRQVVEACRSATSTAADMNIAVACEFHGNTLTDTPQSTLHLLEEVDHPNFLTYWQPAVGADVSRRFEALKLVSPRLSNVHVFQWHGVQRLPLSAGESEWRQYLQHIRSLDGDRYAMIEFVADDRPENFMSDAAILKSWLA